MEDFENFVCPSETFGIITQKEVEITYPYIFFKMMTITQVLIPHMITMNCSQWIMLLQYNQTAESRLETVMQGLRAGPFISPKTSGYVNTKLV